MSPLPRPQLAMASLLFVGAASASLPGCKRNDPPPDPLKTQRESMERAREVGKTMQKGVDAEGRKADEDGK